MSQTLFGALSPAVTGKPEWVLSPDGPLFDVPFATLPAQPGAATLIGDLHSLRTVPGAWVRMQKKVSGASERFVGVADGVYNTADPRWSKSRVAVTGPEMPRLPGSGREVRACAQAWKRGTDPVFITGPDVVQSRVMEELMTRPAILHFSGHVLPHPKMPEQILVALGLQRTGTLDVMTPAEIASTGLSARLVTLSGCGSGSGAALPGLGLFGLSRAWLLAGADAVVASYWPIADDSGELLSFMYEELSKKPGPITASAVAASLQAAQSRVREFGGWRADPAYWAAFAVVGKD
jgi:CHAT domain-containing protein